MAGRRLLLVALLVAAGCTASARPGPAWPDAPYSLHDDDDLESVIDGYWTMPAGAARDQTRAGLTRTLERRLAAAIARDQQAEAEALLDEVVQLSVAPGRVEPVGVDVALLHQLRAMFAKAGALEPAVRVLVLLAEAEPARRAAHLAELDEVLAFADDLAIADNGPQAERAQPLLLLQPTALALPLPWLVDRYVTLLVERQRVVARQLATRGASMQLVRAHRDVLSTARRIANVLARAGRVGEIYARVAPLQGIGADRQLAVRAEIVATQPTAEAYAALAERLREDDPNDRKGDPGAALAVCLAGLAKFPDDADLALAAAGDARDLGHVEQAIALYERGLHGERDIDEAAALQLGSLYGERLERLAARGRPAAARAAWARIVARTDAEAKLHPSEAWRQAQAIAQASLGRGFASQGMVRDARRALNASLGRAPSIDAYETLTTIALQTDDLAGARRWVATALAQLGDRTSGDRYRRAKLQRLDGDALRRAARGPESATVYTACLRSWASLGPLKELPPEVAAERRLEEGRALWWTGEPDRAVDAVLDALELDPDNASITIDAISFLLEVGRYTDALDAYHRGLGADLGDRAKIYMTLWIAGEAKQQGAPLDRLAAEFLASREGDTWYELLARAASGRLELDALRAAATTGPRKAELAYYGAVLGLDPSAATPAGKRALLGQVVAANLVLDAEYDLARRYLATP
jgi:hypothetical protein